MSTPLLRRFSTALLLCIGCAASHAKHAAQDARPAETRPAASQPAPAAGRLDFYVDNLNAEGAPLIRGRLLALEYPVHTCAACKIAQSAAGECPTCKRPLLREARRLVQSAAVDLEARTLVIEWDRDHALRWTEIEPQFAGLGLSFDAAKLALPGDVELVLANGRASLLPQVERTIIDSKLFAGATARWDAERREIRIATTAAARAPSREALLRAVQPTGCSLRDVVWPALPAPR